MAKLKLVFRIMV